MPVLWTICHLHVPAVLLTSSRVERPADTQNALCVGFPWWSIFNLSEKKQSMQSVWKKKKHTLALFWKGSFWLFYQTKWAHARLRLVNLWLSIFVLNLCFMKWSVYMSWFYTLMNLIFSGRTSPQCGFTLLVSNVVISYFCVSRFI